MLVIESGTKIAVTSGAAIDVMPGAVFRVGGADFRQNGTQVAAIANSTPATIINPADSPSTADILRDDLVANTIPSIQSDFTTLAAKVNLILAALRNLGIIDT